MFARSLHRGSWSTLLALRRALQVDRNLATHLCGLQTVQMRPVAAGSNWSAPICRSVMFSNHLHVSPVFCGLEEFFPKTDNLIEEGEKTGKLVEL